VPDSSHATPLPEPAVLNRQALPAAEALVGLVWDGPDAVAVFRLEDGRFLHANEAVSELTGIAREDLIGRTHEGAGLWADPTDLNVLAATLLEEGVVDGLPLGLRLPSGEIQVTHIWAKLCSFNGEAAIVAFARDTTESRRTELLLAVEHAVVGLLSTTSSLREAAAGVLNLLGQRLDWDFGTYWTVDREAGVLRRLAAWSSPLAQPPAENHDDTLTIGADLPGWVWEHAQAVFVIDPAHDPRVVRVPPTPDGGIPSAIAFPVLAGSEVVGVIEFFTCKARPSDDALLESVDAIGRQVGQFARAMDATAAGPAQRRQTR
jgi:PAS domain S-box-containing protein